MPIYCYHDKQSEKDVEVLRSYEEIDEPPTFEEAYEAGLSEVEYKLASWIRHLGKNISVTKGHGWGGGKGHW